jgi:RNA polymerase sigma-70 factor (ECF subfamily)
MSRVVPTAAMQRELVDRAKRGDSDAFTRLVAGSVDRLYAVAALILHDRDRAQDAVQEALVAAWKDIRTLRDADAWDAWLYRLTVWACYRHARRDRRRTIVELSAIPESDAAADVALPIVERDHLERQLARLPIDQRAVIVTRFYLGCPVDEVAEILGLPSGTVKSRLNRGLQALRAGLTAESGRAVSTPPEVRIA